MLYLILITSFTTLYLIFYSLFGVIFRSSGIIGIRLEKIATQSARNADNELSKSLFARIVRPILDDISKTILKVTPKELVSAFEKRVMLAGNPFGFGVKEWINLHVAIILGLPLITIVIGGYKNLGPKNTMLFCLLEIMSGIVLPNFILGSKAGERQKQIRNSLPDVLDLLTVSVEAGLGFDGALAKVTDKMPGALADEFENVLQEMKVGKQKRDALRDMAERTGVPDLTTFVSAIIQADQLGVSIGNVLRIQSEQMRMKRRQRAQEKAMKAPVKMLIPMLLFIFPTIFSVLIGPVVIRVINTFMK